MLTGTRAHRHIQAQEGRNSGPQGAHMERTSLSLKSSKETGTRRQEGSTSRRDQRNKINVTRNQRETEDQEEESQETLYSNTGLVQEQEIEDKRVGGTPGPPPPPGGAAQQQA